MSMPWVFLHAIKDYYEMPWLLSRYPGLKATFNLSASLIEQLELYQDPLRWDYFLSLWILDPSALESSQREWMVKLIRAMQFETMVKPIERYRELFYQPLLSDEELIDLEVVFILAWCGNYLRQNNPSVRRLMEKKRAYTQEDKKELLASLSRFIGEILPFYATLQSQGRISVSTTPYFHPILPLLFEMNNAQIANEHTALPEGVYTLEEDAKEHVRRSIALYERTFGIRPRGFWPAEGAVDERSVALYHDEGIKWIATDEAILYRSLGRNDPSLRYRPYAYSDVAIGFRDHALSDLIGFEYRHRSASDASRHFMDELYRIALANDNPNVFVIVDGENAWEFYHNNGLEFFEGLYEALSTSQWCHTKTLDDVSQQSDIPKLSSLHPGTWIHGTFDTWAGHCEKNRAWELIFQTRKAIEPYLHEIDATLKEEILYHLLASECSDWFWWYGEDHSTDFSAEFDRLFRDHLIRIYTLLDRPIPPELFIPIISADSELPSWTKPSTRISPDIDSVDSKFFDWTGCGMIDETRLFGTMDKVRGPVNIIYYGYDTENLYVAFKGDFEDLDDVSVDVILDHDRLTKTPIVRKKGGLAFSMSLSYLKKSGEIDLRFELKHRQKTIQSLPGFGTLHIDIDSDLATHWFV